MMNPKAYTAPVSDPIDHEYQFRCLLYKSEYIAYPTINGINANIMWLVAIASACEVFSNSSSLEFF